MAYRSSVLLSIFVFLEISILSEGALGPESDLVTGLPGQPTVGFRHYAGYVPVGRSNDKALFYWFFEADGGSEDKPLLLWLNGGHFVPQLAELIYEGNKRASEDSRINFKGIMIGNPVLNSETDQMGMVDYAWSHAIISDQVYSKIKECAFYKGEIKRETKACNHAINAFVKSYSDIDMYSIYTPLCLNHSTTSHSWPRPKLVAAARLFRQHVSPHLNMALSKLTMIYTSDDDENNETGRVA
ncbi:hypothetical protein J5N97_023006 [Dioscorea zingiberensis]|uniref:Serine carboxypeptidase n=1 Tax=Dioscorea zingiberensis TaxID=325984 RepID=A0A9D5HB58_9LILI|nr:hypothetical protein J5N97_023006 [Dioscorea zingiberensis]